MSPVGIVKFVGAWGCTITALGLIIIGHGLPIIAQTVAIVGIAFALAPASW